MDSYNDKEWGIKMSKICKIKTIYNEEFLTEVYYIGRNYIDTDKGRIPENEIKDFAIIGEPL